MRYEKGRKDETRRRILDVASEQFRARGVAAAGLAGIMAEAGLTNGAFYVHFESKDDLVRAVIEDTLTRREEVWKSREERDVELSDVIDNYLSARHRDEPGHGCATAAMVAEVARQPATTRDTFTAKTSSIIARMASRLHGSAGEREAQAIAIHALMVGSLQLARAVNDKNLSDKILTSGAAAARALAKQG